MTLESWLKAIAPSCLHSLFTPLDNRKLHLLAAAFLRRVWDELPSHQTHTAIEATEKFADGALTVEAVTRWRSIDLLESCESLWLHPDSADEVSELIGRFDDSWIDGPGDDREAELAQDGYQIEGVRLGVVNPAWIAVQAAFWAREAVAWASPEEKSSLAAENVEATAQFHIFNEIVGPTANPRWPEWRTDTVRLIARGIHRNRTFDQLPILADALQDAGCDDQVVLAHCRDVREHVRGCWVMDLAMGVA